jgi:hypothetical protein
MLKIALRPSVALLAILLVAHAAAIAAIVVLDVAPAFKFAAGSVLAASLLFNVARYALLRTARSVVALEISSANELSIGLRGGEWVECEVSGDTYVTSFLTVVNLRRRDTRKRVAVPLLPDMLDREDFRKLRAWLRWRPTAT